MVWDEDAIGTGVEAVEVRNLSQGDMALVFAQVETDLGSGWYSGNISNTRFTSFLSPRIKILAHCLSARRTSVNQLVVMLSSLMFLSISSGLPALWARKSEAHS